MREIEVKARVKDVKILIERLTREGVSLSESTSQIDLIFVIKPFKLSEIEKGSSPIVRIRDEENKYTLNLKRDITDQLDCIEHEAEISNTEKVAAILNELGYHQVLKVQKTRRKFRFNDFTGCIDKVEKLGTFIELESIVEDDIDVENVRFKMWNVLEKFNIHIDEKITKGYDRLLDEL